jgi:hypothetical protein
VKWLKNETSSPILCSQWLEFEDETGKHLASPDIVLPAERIVVECKRTYTQEADAQLGLVYGPLLECLYGGPWRLVVAAQHWAGPEQPLLGTFLDAKPGMNYYLRHH